MILTGGVQYFRMITVLLLLTGIAGATPVEEWNRTFDLGGSDVALSVQQTRDGGAISLQALPPRTGLSL